MNKEPERSQRKALGKGLSALLPTRPKASEPQAESGPVLVASRPGAADKFPEDFEEFQSIPLDQIQPSEQQPRGEFDGEKLEELSRSIEAHGVIQPITVQRLGERQYRIIAGERRWRAAALAGLKEIPALVRSVDPNELLELALIENIQREDLNPIEIATAFHKLNTRHGLSHEQIAEKTGKNRSTVTNFMRLLRLVPPVRHELATGGISMGHARALLNVEDPNQQVMLCSDIKKRQLSVREVETLVRNITNTPKSSAKTEEKKLGDFTDPNIRAALEEMSIALGTKVKLVPRGESSGRLEIQYYSQEDLERIYSVIVE